MSAAQRDALLKELYRLSKFKILFEGYVTHERKGTNIAAVFRKFRLWLADLDKELSSAIQAMYRAKNIANKYPNWVELDKIDVEKSDLDKSELQKLVVGKTFNGLARAGNEIEKVMAFVKHAQFSLAAATHPKLRSDAEKKLVPQEPKGLEHHLLVGKKSRNIDLWFTDTAADILRKYHRKDDKPISGVHEIIAAVFLSALGERKAAESIRKYLDRHRGKSPRPPF
jgi:hypothetical protein